jgi:hypothetical protein
MQQQSNTLRAGPVNPETSSRRPIGPLWRPLLLFLLLINLLPSPLRAQEPDATPEWLEPHGLSIIDLVGIVPEEQLRGSVVRWAPGFGIVVYEWGRREGDTVRVRVSYAVQWSGAVLCLGKQADRDEWPVASPPGTVRVFNQAGADITRQLSRRFWFRPAGLTQPTGGTDQQRYPEYEGELQFTAAGEAIVPANTGCQMWIYGAGNRLAAEWTFTTPPAVSVQPLGSFTTTVESYIGPGYAGHLASLSSQMRSRYADRHNNIRVSLPRGANYILVRFPMQPVDPYGPALDYPGYGTYRIRQPDGRLSVDHINAMGIPYYGQWQDADQSDGARFLPHFSDGVALTAPEYFLPPGFTYDRCMTDGGCPRSLLEAIYNNEMPYTVHFYTVSPASPDALLIPLRQVGPGYRPAAEPASAAPEAAGPYRLYLPAASRLHTPPTFNTTNCPCGWFLPDGRMVGFVPRPR